jgi:hypothetical protein
MIKLLFIKIFLSGFLIKALSHGSVPLELELK